MTNTEITALIERIEHAGYGSIRALLKSDEGKS